MLRPFTEADFNTLNLWVTTEELLLQFSATTFPYPLQYTDMLAYGMANPHNKFYMAYDAEIGDYGFGEIIAQPGNVPRLGRLLIGLPQLRGKGLGKKLVALLLNECKTTYDATGTELYVLTDNYAGINCYVASGFVFVDDGVEIDLNGTIKTMRKMRLEF